MNTSARYSFAAGIALACGAFTLTAMSAAPVEAPTPEPTATVASTPAPTATAQYAPADAPAPVFVQDAPAAAQNAPAEGPTDTVYVPETAQIVQESTGEVLETVAPTYTLPPCQYEDSDNCYWDAASMGNGEGTSFITLNGVTYYPGGN